MADKFDLIVVGAAPGGYPAAIRLSEAVLETTAEALREGFHL